MAEKPSTKMFRAATLMVGAGMLAYGEGLSFIAVCGAIILASAFAKFVNM